MAREKIERLLEILPESAYLMTCFGEIDCRALILKKGKENARKRLGKALSSYARFLDFLIEKKRRLIVYGPVPTQKDTHPIDVDYPRYGIETERNQLTREFNDELQKICATRRLPFFTLFYDLVDESGRTREGVTKDGCHLSASVYPLALERFKAALREQ